MTSNEPLIRRVAEKVHGRLPFNTERLISPAYYKYLSKKADTNHQVSDQLHEPNSDTPDHMLIVVIDALRPDFTPEIGVPFSRAISASTWTFPSVTSIHTGQYPHEHGAVAHTAPDADTYAIPKQSTSEGVLPRLFEQSGYDTYTGCSFITPFLAIRGWYQKHRVYGDVPAKRVISDYLDWREGRQKTFAYLHTGDLHEPINPPSEYIERRDVDMSLNDLALMTQYTDDYDGSEECAYFREQRLKLYQAALDYVSEKLEYLIEQISEDTAIVIAGDHGEAHWEHYDLDRQFTDSRPNYGVGHGGTPLDMVARVPVGLQLPNKSVSFNGGWPSLIDIPATLSSELAGQSRYPSLNWFNEIPVDRSVLCEGVRYGTERKAAYRGEYKVIKSESDNVTLSARVLPDSGEKFEPIPEQEEQELTQSLPNAWDDFENSEKPTKGVESQLKALGYK